MLVIDVSGEVFKDVFICIKHGIYIDQTKIYHCLNRLSSHKKVFVIKGIDKEAVLEYYLIV